MSGNGCEGPSSRLVRSPFTATDSVGVTEESNAGTNTSELETSVFLARVSFNSIGRNNIEQFRNAVIVCARSDWRSKSSLCDFFASEPRFWETGYWKVGPGPADLDDDFGERKGFRKQC